LCGGNDKIVKVSALREVIEDTGVRWNDPRLQNMVEGIRKIQTPEKNSYQYDSYRKAPG